MTDSIKKAQHTPGPWTVGVKNRPECATVYTEIKGVAVSVAYCDLSLPWSTNMSNACLVAAAPDLLEALQEIVCTAADCKGWEEVNPSFSKARAAIAKATGKK